MNCTPDLADGTDTLAQSFQMVCYRVTAHSVNLSPCEGICQPQGNPHYYENVFFCFASVPQWMMPFIAIPQETDDLMAGVKNTDEPVDTVYGNMFTFPQVDFTLSGINQPFRFYRTYHS